MDRAALLSKEQRTRLLLARLYGSSSVSEVRESTDTADHKDAKGILKNREGIAEDQKPTLSWKLPEKQSHRHLWITILILVLLGVAWHFGVTASGKAGAIGIWNVLCDAAVAIWNMLCGIASALEDFLQFMLGHRK